MWRSCSFIAGGLLALLVASSEAHALPITNGSFEQGNLLGWQAHGDVSVQTAAIGESPADGNYHALLAVDQYGSFSGNPQASGDFYSTVGFPRFFGPPSAEPPANYPGAINRTYSALRQNIYLGEGESLSFKFDFITQDGAVDYAFFFVQALDKPNPYTYLFPNLTTYAEPLSGPNEYQWSYILTPAQCAVEPFLPTCFGPSQDEMPLQPSGVDLCMGAPNCGSTSLQTGYQPFSWQAPQDGNFAFYVGAIQTFDHLVPSALLVDDFQIHPVSEPATIALLGAGLAGLLVRRRRRDQLARSRR